MNTITLFDTSIRQDAQGRFCLNDLHRASGESKKHQPANFLRLDTTVALVAEIDNSSDLRSYPTAQREARNGDTYVCRELVCAYAMWIDPKLFLSALRLVEIGNE